MRFQLLLIGAIAALTLGAVSLAGSAPTASISALPPSATTTSAEVPRAPEVANFPTPAAGAVSISTDTATTTIEAVVEPAAAPAASTTPASCTTAIQLVQAAHRRLGPAKAVIASAIAECFGQLPSGKELQVEDSDSGDHAGGD